ncbi:fibroblast growth factor 23 [Arapaima gigas]
MLTTVSVCALALSLAALPSSCAPNLSPLLGSDWGSARRYVHLQTSSEFNNVYLEIRANGHVRNTTSRSAYSVVLLKAETRDSLAIYGVKSNRYLCLDEEGIPFSSSVCSRDDCLFHHKLLENHRDIYYSCKSSLLLNLEGAKQVYEPGHNLPVSALFLSERNTVPLRRLLHRERRNRHVDLLDPLHLHGQHGEGSDSLPYPDTQVEQEGEAELSEQGWAVSREGIAFGFHDDPLRVLHSINPHSPRNAAHID